jgi:hypothetical protein
MSFVKSVFISATLDITSMAITTNYQYSDVGYIEKSHIKHGNFFWHFHQNKWFMSTHSVSLQLSSNYNCINIKGGT